MYLLVTERIDPHADFVEAELDRRGIEWLRLHLSDLPLRLGGMLELRGSALAGRVRIREREFDIDEISAVWYRRTERVDVSAIDDPEMRRFAADETRHFVRGLWAATARARWVSPPDRIAEATVKLVQLARARRLGFNVPETIVTNDAACVREFVDRIGGPGAVIYKPHTSLIAQTVNDEIFAVAYTTPLDEMLMHRLEEIRLAPGIFQQRISKTGDVRVTVVGERCFAVAISSQDNTETREDWRAFGWQGRMPLHERLEIDGELAGKCIGIVASYGLAYGAIDLAIDRAGEAWFLELNPNGQWAWIQHATGMPIREALCDYLQGRQQ